MHPAGRARKLDRSAHRFDVVVVFGVVEAWAHPTTRFSLCQRNVRKPDVLGAIGAISVVFHAGDRRRRAGGRSSDNGCDSK